MSQGWIVVNQEFNDHPYLDERCTKAFFNYNEAYHFCLELNSLPEVRGRISFGIDYIKPENGYGLFYPYGIKEIEIDIT